jgi:hypothetical protein
LQALCGTILKLECIVSARLSFRRLCEIAARRGKPTLIRLAEISAIAIATIAMTDSGKRGSRGFSGSKQKPTPKA